MDVNSPTTVRALYEGIFRRIATSHPVDFYWLWTDEGWGTEGGGQKQKPAEDMPKAIADIEMAIAAHKAVAPPFRIALSGWGKNHCAPEVGHLAFDKALPKDIPFAALIHGMGSNRLDPAFREIKDRQRWSIPWCEQDGGVYGLVDLQLAVGRQRYDAMEARNAGCSGLMGLDWRTQHVAPNISALG